MIQAAQRVHQRLNLTSNIIIRDCVEDDLPHLEWFGWYTGFRDAIRATYRRQERGDASIIVADLQGFPIGQVWVEYGRRNIDAVGYIWALRVIPFLRNNGIGTTLLLVAEQQLRQRGFTWAELGVEKHSRANALYQRLGYQIIGASIDDVTYRTPEGELRRDPIDQWICRKNLRFASSRPVLANVQVETT